MGEGWNLSMLITRELRTFSLPLLPQRNFFYPMTPIFFDKPEYVNSSCGELEAEVEGMEARLDALINNRSGEIGILKGGFQGMGFY